MILSIILGSIIIILICWFLYIKRVYSEELLTISKKEYKFKKYLPIGLFFRDTKFGGEISSKTNLNIMELYGRKEYSKRLRLYEGERITISLLILFLSLVLMFFMSIKNISIVNISQINKPKYGEGEKTYRYFYELESQKKPLEGISITVPEIWPNEKEANKELKKILKELPEMILQDNLFLNYVDKPLSLPTKLKEGIEIIWKSQNEKLLLSNGEIRYNNLTSDGEEVLLTAEINCFGLIENLDIPINLYRKSLSPYEERVLIKKEISKALSKEETFNNNEKSVFLPSKISNHNEKITWYNGEKNGPYSKYLIITLCLSTAFYILKRVELDKKVKERREEILRAFPGFINKFVLLMNAGMPFSRAWEKIHMDYISTRESNNKRNILYEEMVIVMEDIKKGISEIKAYEAFGQRCKIPEVLRFTAIIIQNIKKGSHLLISGMEQQSKEALALRVDIAKKKGEKASTRLILPMGLMFLAILIIVIAPALITLRLS